MTATRCCIIHRVPLHGLRCPQCGRVESWLVVDADTGRALAKADEDRIVLGPALDAVAVEILQHRRRAHA